MVIFNRTQRPGDVVPDFYRADIYWHRSSEGADECENSVEMLDLGPFPTMALAEAAAERAVSRGRVTQNEELAQWPE